MHGALGVHERGQRFASPSGSLNPEPSVLIVGDAGMLPPTASISFTALWPPPPTKTFPSPSTATRKSLKV